MATATDLQAGLAYDIEGTGTPVVFLHGLTFDRRTWRPVIDRPGGAVTSIAIDLPAHGDSGGEPAPLERVAERVHRLLHSSGIERPVVAGHSMAAGVAGLYASAHPARGIVLVDQATEILPFTQMLHQATPMLRGPAFGQVWAGIENGLGLDRIPEPARTLVLDTHKVNHHVVLGYWDQVLTTEPAELQAWIDDKAARIQVPCLAVFGRPATGGERERLGRLPDAQIEEWAGDGHSSTSSIPGGSRPGSGRSSDTATRRADHGHHRCGPGQHRHHGPAGAPFSGRSQLRMAGASRPPAETGRLPEDPAPAELSNQAMPAPPARYGPISHPRTQAL